MSIDYTLCGVPLDQRPTPITHWPEYTVWRGMIQRCHGKNPHPRYGGRGIKVCDEWRASFSAFVQHIGVRSSRELSVDRINNDGNYEPGNVHWASSSDQAYNKGVSVATVRAVARERAETRVRAAMAVDLAGKIRAERAKPHPVLGLGAVALRQWVKDAQETGGSFAAKVGVSRVTYHTWVTAGWFEGGEVPTALHRKKIHALTNGSAHESLFDQDDARRSLVRSRIGRSVRVPLESCGEAALFATIGGC